MGGTGGAQGRRSVSNLTWNRDQASGTLRLRTLVVRGSKRGGWTFGRAACDHFLSRTPVVAPKTVEGCKASTGMMTRHSATH